MAPTPVSALLHAGVVNGAGVLVLKTHPMLAASSAAFVLLFAAGVATAVVATSIMIVRTDVKGSLVWSTAGQMGFMTAQLGAGALAPAFFHLVGHAMYKAAAFLGAGDAISARARRMVRPGRHAPPTLGTRAGSLLIAAGAVAASLIVVDPHLGDAALVLAATFATLSVAAAVSGWVRSVALPAATAWSAALVGAIVLAGAYVAGLAVVEGFVVDEVPFEISAAVGAPGVIAAIAGLLVGVAVVALWPGSSGVALRAWLYTILFRAGAPLAVSDRPGAVAVEPVPSSITTHVATGPDGGAHLTVEQRSRLVADVAAAGSTVAPSWPLTTFVAVNPLGAFVDRPFDEALREGHRWFDADGALPTESYRRLHRDGRLSDAEIDTAIVEHDALFATPWTISLGGNEVDVIEIVRHDLLHGPIGRRSVGGPTGSVHVDRIVTSWCAAFADDDGVAWAMPGRDRGFHDAWRALARHDRAFRQLVGASGLRRLPAVPEHRLDAIAMALDELDVDEADRVDQLRAWLLRTPGWAGFARWCDDWAPADHAGARIRVVDLIAVRAVVEMVAPPEYRTRPLPVEMGAATSRDEVAARLDSVIEVYGAPTGRALDDLHGVLGMLSDSVRAQVLLAAHELRTRDRILGAIDAAAPAAQRSVDEPSTDRTVVEPSTDRTVDDPSTDRTVVEPSTAGLGTGSTIDALQPVPDAQIVCCIDVRSEGLRRQLEQRGTYETFGFAGFFGVPIRWRPLGATTGQARCPVLVTPQHEIVETPLDDAADAHLRRQTLRHGLDEARHHTKTGLGSPFAMAESLGWVSGPLAAARTLRPGSRPAPDRPDRTRALVERERATDVRSGLTLEERTLFAEAIVATIGFRGFAPLVVLCGHGAATVNNPHGSSLDCGACGGAPGGASARVAAEILNDPAVRARLLERSIDVPATTVFVAAEHDTIADSVEFFDLDRLPAEHAAGLAALRRDLAAAGAANAADRSSRLPGRPDRVTRRGGDWAETRQEWGLAGNAAFVIGPRSITAGTDLGGRAFLHSYDAELDTDGRALQTIMTAPLVVGQWISSQYHFSTTAPNVFGAGDKMLHNPVGGVGVLVGPSGGDLASGLPAQSVSVGGSLAHEPVRLHAIIQAPLDRIERIIRSNDGLRSLVEHRWIEVVARPDPSERWSVRRPGGTWVTWWPADASVPESTRTPVASVPSELVTS
ncbi:MAG: putative inorganic carbon transporter subunit DabA [Actinomycetota bacterium]